MSIISGAKPGVIANYGACQVKIGNKSRQILTISQFAGGQLARADLSELRIRTR